MSVGLNPRFTFDAFVVGPANQLAVTAARAVAESPGSAYNPLFISGRSGVGKTHLMMAVGQLAKTLSPAAAVDYLTLDAFQEAFFAARAAGQSQAFRNRLGALDLLLVDDVHYLARLGETQQELLRLVQHLQSTTKQIVLAGEAAPTDIQDMDERLRVQLDGGLVVDITPPEFETRLTILQRRTAERGAELAPAVLETIAGIELESVRELLGFLNRVVALQAVSENPLTPEVVEALMAGARTAYTVGGTGVGPAREPDEFAAFMTDVAEEIEHQVEAWRARLTDGLERWKNEGYRTARLEQLLQQDVPVAVDQALKEFERDVKRLRSLETAMEAIQPGRAEDSVFRDPERVAEAEAMVQDATKHRVPPPAPSAAWRFATYVEGEANREALRVAQSATGEPGRGGSLLLIVGPTGVGKTHLLHAIGNALSSASQAMVACFSAQQFQDELEEALSSEAPGQWLSRYQPVGAFLLDDVQLLIREKRAQHELAHLITRFQASGRQVVLTASAPPGEIEGLQERLAGLLERGYVVRIDTPDRDLRRAIVARKLEERHGEVSGELADYLAARSANGIRAVVTMVQRVLDTAESRGVTPSVTLARELIEGTQPVRPRPGGMRTSGVVISPLGGVRSREKMVWSWPDPGERLIEELY
jgi:chromosomal replication initiation ATPase DnaA